MHAIALIVAMTAGAAAPEADLRLVAHVSKREIAPYEPVVLTYDIENVSNQPQLVQGHIDPALGWVKFEITDAEGVFRPYRTGIEGVSGHERFTLQPGDNRSGQIIVLTNAIGRPESGNPPIFPFGKAGPYKLRVSFPLDMNTNGESRRTLVSTVDVTVRSSMDTADDLSMFANLDDFAAAVGADAGDPDLATAIPRWEHFVATAKGSVFTPFVEFNLATNYKLGVGTEPPNYPLAASHYWAVANAGVAALADDALIGFAESQIELGNFGEAKRALKRVLAEYPRSNSQPQALRLRDGLRTGKKTLREIY